jgi:hypothetical protein
MRTSNLVFIISRLRSDQILQHPIVLLTGGVILATFIYIERMKTSMRAGFFVGPTGLLEVV